MDLLVVVRYWRWNLLLEPARLTQTADALWSQRLRANSLLAHSGGDLHEHRSAVSIEIAPRSE